MRQKLCSWGVVWLSMVGSFEATALSLEAAIQHTLQTNPEMLAVQHETVAREFEVKQARAGYLPELSVTAGLGRETRTAPATGNETVELDRQELGLQAKQMVFDGFATSSEVSRQVARVESIGHEGKATAERLALDVSESYLNVLRRASLLDLTRDTLWEHQNIYDQMKLRSEKGVGSKADLDQIAARLALANANMVVAQTNLADAQTHFYRVTGLYPNLVNMKKPEAKGVLPASRDKAISVAISNHPQLQSASADVSAAKSQYEAAGSRFWPSVSLEAEKRWDDNVGAVPGEDEDLIVALRLRYELYSGGANKSRRQQTAYLVEEAKSVRNNSRRQVVESMNLSWNAYEALDAQMVFLEQHVTAAKNTKSAYIKQFNIGRRTLLDLLNTETEVVEARRALINAQFDSLFARFRIFNAAGQLINVLAEQH